MKAEFNDVNDDIHIYPESEEEKDRMIEKFGCGGNAIVIHAGNEPGLYLLIEI